MCIYCGTKNYRKIYEQHHGPIGKEGNGRSYEIHHIDGDHSNNNPDNLKAVTIQEHYDIHFSQGDIMACVRIGSKMKLPAEIISNLSRDYQKSLVESGKHHFLGGDQSRKNAKKLVEEGRHPFSGGQIQSKTNNERLDRNEHPSQIKVCCIHCHKTIDLANFGRSHGDNCRIVAGKKKHKTNNSKRGSDHPRYDATIHHFVHVSGIEEFCTNYELSKKYKINNVAWLVSGKHKVSKGWSIADKDQN
jgi:hypothetical protein